MAGGCGLVAGLGAPKVLEDPGAEGVDDGGGSTQAVRIAVGQTHACAIVQVGPGSPENGTVRCWGSNGEGELGTDPTALALSLEPRPVDTGDASTTTATGLALGAESSCAITTDGYLQCWGDVPGESTTGVHREDGEGARPYEATTMYIGTVPLVSVTTASVGLTGGCAIADSHLVCWGDTEYAPGSAVDAGLGGLDGGVVIGDDTFTSAAVGTSHVCAIATRSGVTDVECWGGNEYGQTGVSEDENPGTVTRPTPVGLATLGEGIRQVAVGGDESCALLANGAVYCWGRNNRGQVGNPAAGSSTSVAMQVVFPAGEGIGTPQELAVAESHVCTVTDATTVWCWGDNSAGQLGTGSTSPPFSVTPTQVQKRVGSLPTIQGVTHIAAGGETSCAIRVNDARVWCWGANDSGQVGQAPSRAVAYATPVAW